jgi:hypothetical protein
LKRITYFGKHFLGGERVNINCSIMAWKLLKTISLTPVDEDLNKMIQTF